MISHTAGRLRAAVSVAHSNTNKVETTGLLQVHASHDRLFAYRLVDASWEISLSIAGLIVLLPLSGVASGGGMAGGYRWYAHYSCVVVSPAVLADCDPQLACH